MHFMLTIKHIQLTISGKYRFSKNRLYNKYNYKIILLTQHEYDTEWQVTRFAKVATC